MSQSLEDTSLKTILASRERTQPSSPVITLWLDLSILFPINNSDTESPIVVDNNNNNNNNSVMGYEVVSQMVIPQVITLTEFLIRI